MRGHEYWEPAQGTIVRVETKQPHRRSDAMHPEHHYVIDVRLSSGSIIRGTAKEKSATARSVGLRVQVEVHPKNNEIRLDPNSSPDVTGGMVNADGLVNMADQIRAATAGIAAGGSGIAAMDGLSGAIGAIGALGALAGQPGVHIIDASGQEVQLGTAQGQELQQLAQAMMSGDPAARQAAVERIRQIKAERAGRAAPPTAAASTFDPLGPASTAGTFGQPAQNTFGQPAQNTFGQPAQNTFGQPTTPSPYGQVTPPVSFGPPAAFDSLSPGAGEGSAEQRLARLQQLLDKGILTESEYTTLRQQILNGG
jgi:hypothetical protein